MPAHIYLRSGDFARASESDQGSIDASDAFNVAVKALSSQGGLLGTSVYPAQVSDLSTNNHQPPTTNYQPPTDQICITHS